MAKKKDTHMKGDGKFVVRSGIIYVHGSINGKFYRKSTGKRFSSKREKWMKKQDPLGVLADILGVTIKENHTSGDLRVIGYEALEVQANAKKITESHRKDKIRAFENKILLHFEHIDMKDISVKNVVDWINYLKEEYSFTHVKFIKNLFNSIFEYAYHDLDDVVDRNPFNSMTVKSIDLSWNATTEVYTTHEVAKMLKESTGWFKVFMDLTLKYGFRPSEIMVIKWSDIDMKRGALQLQRSINADTVIVEHTSNKGNKNHFRLINMFSSTLKLLKNYYEVRPDKEWLFINKDGKPFMQSQSVADYHFKPLLKEIGVKYKTLYAARRTYASIMSHSGEDLAKIQQTMGHAEGSEVTEKHYISDEVLSNEDRENEAKRQEDLFNKLVKLDDEDDTEED